VEYLDLFSLFMGHDSAPIKDYLLDDGVHLSNKGYIVWSGAVEEWIRSVILRSEISDRS
jgi:lysophospholipase L1-like esterase